MHGIEWEMKSSRPHAREGSEGTPRAEPCGMPGRRLRVPLVLWSFWLVFAWAVVPALANPSYVAHVGGAGSKDNSVSVEMPNDWQVRIELELSRVKLESVDADSGLYRVRVPEIGILGQEGAPDVPTYYRLVALPPGAEVEFVHWAADAEIIPDVEVAALVDSSPPADAVAQPATESASLPLVEVGKTFVWRGLRVVPVWLRPIDYDPASQSVTVVPFVEVTLNLVGVSFAAMDVPFSLGEETYFDGAVANWELLKASGAVFPAYSAGVEPEKQGGGNGPLDFVNCGDYLIITADDFEGTAPMAQLVGHLTVDRGYEVVVWKVGDIVADPCDQDKDEIRNKIRR